MYKVLAVETPILEDRLHEIFDSGYELIHIVPCKFDGMLYYYFRLWRRD